MALSHSNGQSPRRAVGKASPEPPRQGRAGDASARRVGTTGGVATTGWREIAWRSYENAQDDRVLLFAAGVTFYGLLALFPATAAIVSLYGLFADPLSFNAHLGLLSGFLPQGALEVVGDQVKRITAHGPATLGFTFLGTLALSLWGANAGTKSIFDALNIIYKEREKCGFIKLTLWSLAFTIGAIGLAVLSLVGIIACRWCSIFWASRNNLAPSSSPFCAGHCSTLWFCSGSLVFIAMVLAAPSRSGGG